MGIKFEKIEEGMTLYDVHSTRMGNTTIREQGLWRVRVIAVDTEKRKVLASWNGNKPRWYFEGQITKFRKNPPEWMRRSMSRRGRYYCPTCNAYTDEKDSSKHEETCVHPKAIAYRKKRERNRK